MFRISQLGTWVRLNGSSLASRPFNRTQSSVQSSFGHDGPAKLISGKPLDILGNRPDTLQPIQVAANAAKLHDNIVTKELEAKLAENAKHVTRQPGTPEVSGNSYLSSVIAAVEQTSNQEQQSVADALLGVDVPAREDQQDHTTAMTGEETKKERKDVSDQIDLIPGLAIERQVAYEPAVNSQDVVDLSNRPVEMNQKTENLDPDVGPKLGLPTQSLNLDIGAKLTANEILPPGGVTKLQETDKKADPPAGDKYAATEFESRPLIATGASRMLAESSLAHSTDQDTQEVLEAYERIKKLHGYSEHPFTVKNVLTKGVHEEEPLSIDTVRKLMSKKALTSTKAEQHIEASVSTGAPMSESIYSYLGIKKPKKVISRIIQVTSKLGESPQENPISSFLGKTKRNFKSVISKWSSK